MIKIISKFQNCGKEYVDSAKKSYLYCDVILTQKKFIKTEKGESFTVHNMIRPFNQKKYIHGKRDTKDPNRFP